MFTGPTDPADNEFTLSGALLVAGIAAAVTTLYKMYQSATSRSEEIDLQDSTSAFLGKRARPHKRN